MPSRRAIQGALHNFLGTLTSRNSDFEGYWLFGFLVEGMQVISVDLLVADPDIEGADAMPLGAFKQFAMQRFAEQLAKAGVAKVRVREAVLKVSKPAVSRIRAVNGHLALGHDIQFGVGGTTDLGRPFAFTISRFVAPHNPQVEQRSGRAG